MIRNKHILIAILIGAFFLVYADFNLGEAG